MRIGRLHLRHGGNHVRAFAAFGHVLRSLASLGISPAGSRLRLTPANRLNISATAEIMYARFAAFGHKQQLATSKQQVPLSCRVAHGPSAHPWK